MNPTYNAAENNYQTQMYAEIYFNWRKPKKQMFDCVYQQLFDAGYVAGICHDIASDRLTWQFLIKDLS